MDRRTFLALALAAPAFGAATRVTAQSAPRTLAWTQWGGPHRNFQTDASGLKDTWPASGPPVVWKRTLGANGGKGSQAILAAVDARSGKIHWQERSIEKATFVWADQKLITLDQDGNLMMAYPSPQGFKITAKAPLLSRLSWTPPALVGTRAYLRDRRSLMAVELG